MFTVKVVETSTGRPVKGAKVTVGSDGLLRGFGIVVNCMQIVVI